MLSRLFATKQSSSPRRIKDELHRASNLQSGFASRLWRHGTDGVGDVPETPDAEFQEELARYIQACDAMEVICDSVERMITTLTESTDAAVGVANAFVQPGVCSKGSKQYRLAYLRHMSTLFNTSKKVISEECWAEVLLPLQTKMNDMKGLVGEIEERTRIKEEYDYRVHKVTMLTRQLISAKHKHLAKVSRLSTLDHKLEKHHKPLIEAVERNRGKLAAVKTKLDIASKTLIEKFKKCNVNNVSQLLGQHFEAVERVHFLFFRTGHDLMERLRKSQERALARMENVDGSKEAKEAAIENAKPRFFKKQERTPEVVREENLLKYDYKNQKGVSTLIETAPQLESSESVESTDSSASLKEASKLAQEQRKKFRYSQLPAPPPVPQRRKSKDDSDSKAKLRRTTLESVDEVIQEEEEEEDEEKGDDDEVKIVDEKYKEMKALTLKTTAKIALILGVDLQETNIEEQKRSMKLVKKALKQRRKSGSFRLPSNGASVSSVNKQLIRPPSVRGKLATDGEGLKSGYIVKARRGSKIGQKGKVVRYNETKGRWLIDWGVESGGQTHYKESNLLIEKVSNTDQIDAKERTDWKCEKKCGFCGTFSIVAEHEKTCQGIPIYQSQDQSKDQSKEGKDIVVKMNNYDSDEERKNRRRVHIEEFRIESERVDGKVDVHEDEIDPEDEEWQEALQEVIEEKKVELEKAILENDNEAAEILKDEICALDPTIDVNKLFSNEEFQDDDTLSSSTSSGEEWTDDDVKNDDNFTLECSWSYLDLSNWILSGNNFIIAVENDEGEEKEIELNVEKNNKCSNATVIDALTHGAESYLSGNNSDEKKVRKFNCIVGQQCDLSSLSKGDAIQLWICDGCVQVWKIAVESD
eukprot:g1194.t1